MRVLGLALYGPLAASTRYRLGQYTEGLAANGIELQICSLLGDDYLHRRFAGEPVGLGLLLKSIARRVGDLLHQGSFDAAVLHCELMPLLPGPVEAALLRVPYVYDFDDAFYLKYSSGLARVALGNKFGRVMRKAHRITAGSRVLADYARGHNAATHYLPTVVDTARYKPAGTQSNTFTVGWIGSPSTARYLSQLVEPLERLAHEGRVRVIVIGGRAPAIRGAEVSEIPWTEADEVRLINTFDVGVMPLPDDAWARGKCGFKLIQYMACGVPVIASAVGANVDVVGPGCGLLASTTEDWIEALRTMRDQPATRRSMGEAARARIVQHYSIDRTLPVMACLIGETAMRC